MRRKTFTLFSSSNLDFIFSTGVSLLKGICILRESDTISGTIHLSEQPGQNLKLTGQIKNISAGFHGFHIHHYGDLTNGCKSTGGHFNPSGVVHGGKFAVNRHVGDLGNIFVDQSEIYHLDMTDGLAKLSGRHSIYGRAIVIHAGRDDNGRGGDEGSLKTGNAGGRLACCIIAHSK